MPAVGYGAVEGPSGAGEAPADEPADAGDRAATGSPVRYKWDRVLSKTHGLVADTAAFTQTAVGKVAQTAQGLVSAEADGPKEPEWHANGTIVGLVVDVGSTSGYYMFLILTMFFGLEANKADLLSCTVGDGQMQFKTWPQACLCEYTKAHLLVFPTLAVSVVLVIMARDLLQKRLYYGMLRNGGVVDFSHNTVFKDSLVLLLMVNFLHVVAHLALMYWVGTFETRSPPEDAPSVVAPGFLRHQAEAMQRRFSLENGNLHVLGFLWGTVMIPGTLVVVFVFLGYDIEKYLVPLSMYIHGLHDSVGPEEALNALVVFRDATAREVIQDPSGPVAEGSGTELDTQYKAIVDKASEMLGEKEGRKKDEERAAIGLHQALWPVALLLRSNTPDSDARTFRWLYLAFASASISMMVFGLLTLGPQMLADFLLATEEGKHQVFAQVPVLAYGIFLVFLVVKQFAGTFASHSVAKRMLANEGKETPNPAFSTSREALAAEGAGGDESHKTK